MTNFTLFSQITKHLDRNLFNNVVRQYQTDKYNKGINSWTHLIAMVFCHLAKAQSIREVTNGLLSAGGNVNHLGIIRKVPTKSSLSYINSTRDWRVFKDYFLSLYDSFQQKGYFKRKKFMKIKRKIYMLDSTIILLCLKVFDWARYRKEKGAIKLHVLLDYDGCMPKYLFITEGRQADVKHAKYMSLPPNSVLVIDRGYIDFKLLNQWSQENIFFVAMIKDSIKYTAVEEKPLPEGKWENILKDEIIELSGLETKQSYPEKLRRVVVYDEKQKRTIELLTNNFNWTAETISELYRQRWQIEIFFKQLKNHLKIKSFIGTNENAIWIQIWTALITLLILKFLKEIAKYP